MSTFFLSRSPLAASSEVADSTSVEPALVCCAAWVTPLMLLDIPAVPVAAFSVGLAAMHGNGAMRASDDDGDAHIVVAAQACVCAERGGGDATRAAKRTWLHPDRGAIQRAMTTDWLSVETARLILRTLPPPALAALVAGDRAEASRLTRCDLGGFPGDQLSIAEVRLKDVAADPDYLPWSLRVMALKPDLRFVGHFNFHTKPNADYLKELAPGAVEMGYFVLPEFRRLGLAEEAALGMMDWAGRGHGVCRFVVSISPENAPSVAMARKLGFTRIGSHIDEEDGYEDILARDNPL